MSKQYIFLWVMAALILAFFISPFASSSPDGLEKVAENKGFLEKGEVSPVLTGLIPDYVCPGVDNERLATGIAGVLGTLIVFGLSLGLGAVIKKRQLK
jgi:cobalt/nickel transport protein